MHFSLNFLHSLIYEIYWVLRPVPVQTLSKFRPRSRSAGPNRGVGTGTGATSPVQSLLFIFICFGHAFLSFSLSCLFSCVSIFVSDSIDFSFVITAMLTINPLY